MSRRRLFIKFLNLKGGRNREQGNIKTKSNQQGKKYFVPGHLSTCSISGNRYTHQKVLPQDVHLCSTEN